MSYRSASSAASDFTSQTDQAFDYLQKTAFEMEQQTATYYQLARTATEVAAKLGDVIANMASTMAMISDSSQKIGDIINVTDSIVFQANSESLKADSDTTGADIHSHDFSVRLSESYRLESLSQAEIKKIKVLIDAFVEMVENGTRLVIDAGQTMPEVVGRISLINDLISKIAAVSRKHTFGMSEHKPKVFQLKELAEQKGSIADQDYCHNPLFERLGSSPRHR